MENVLKAVDVFMREEIDKLEIEKKKVEKQIEKLKSAYNTNDVEKFIRLSNEVNAINHTIFNIYALLGGMNRRVKEIIEKQ